MNKKHYTLLALLGIVLVVAGIFYYFTSEKTAPIVNSGLAQPLQAGSKGGVGTFVSDTYKMSMSFSSKYIVAAAELDATTTPNLMVALLLDTPENRDIVDGKVETSREGATGITINVQKNPDGRSPEEWAKQNTNWNISDKILATTTIAGVEGVMFRWSGLYEGASLIATQGKFAYIFAVSWEGASDPIIGDFDQVLASFQFNK